MDLEEKIQQIKTKEDFIKFVNMLAKDTVENQEECVNDTLPEYFEAIGRWTESMNGYYNFMALKIPENVDWRIFARILTAARIYE